MSHPVGPGLGEVPTPRPSACTVVWEAACQREGGTRFGEHRSGFKFQVCHLDVAGGGGAARAHVIAIRKICFLSNKVCMLPITHIMSPMQEHPLYLPNCSHRPAAVLQECGFPSFLFPPRLIPQPSVFDIYLPAGLLYSTPCNSACLQKERETRTPCMKSF